MTNLELSIAFMIICVLNIAMCWVAYKDGRRIDALEEQLSNIGQDSDKDGP